MGRIRRFFVEAAPEAQRYLILPTTDDPRAVLGGTGIRLGGHLRGLVTATGVVAMVNSVVGGVLAGLVATKITGSTGITALVAGGVFLVSLGFLMETGRHRIHRNVAEAEVRFPLEPPPAA
jgi:hypothetical protein